MSGTVSISLPAGAHRTAPSVLKHKSADAGMAPTRDLNAAREAYTQGDRSLSIEAHGGTATTRDTGTLVEATEAHKSAASEHMKTVIFGGLDGIITTFAVVAGAGGGGLDVDIVLILGFSSLVADALSMGVGDALSSKAASEVAVKEKKRERWELENFPEGEVKEMVDIYEQRGMSRSDAEVVVTTLAKYEEIFLDAMMRDELGMEPPGNEGDHWKSGAICFSSFVVCGSVPLIGFVAFMPLVEKDSTLFIISCVLTAVALFTLGAVKSRFTTKSWWFSGVEILAMGALTAGAAYLIGWGVERIVNTDATQ